MLIEKRLGLGESIMIKTNSLIAFERTVYFHSDISGKNKNEFFVAEGPGIYMYNIFKGLIIFELNHVSEKKKEAFTNLKYIGILTLLFTLVSFVPYLLEDWLKIPNLTG